MMFNERGIAMPMALIVLLVLTALMAAFAVLATSEPQIAANQEASAQARALAESGVSRALWALNAGQESPPPATGALVLDASYNLPSPLPAPYDGSAAVALGVGAFKVTVANGSAINEKKVTAVGYVPSATAPTAIKKIQVTVMRFKWINPVCGLCAGGEQPPGDVTSVQVGGSAAVNATTSQQGHGGNTVVAGATCAGAAPVIAAVASTGTVSTNGSPNFYTPPSTPGTLNNATYPSGMLLSNTDMATLKALAMARGTYWKGNPPWNGGLPPSNGLIFVDTSDGSVLTSSTPSANIPTVSIHSNGSWSGWLVVAGSVDISGDVTMKGLIYSQNDVNLHGTGGGSIQGAVITTNRVDTSSTNIDSQDIGNAPISYNCPYVQSGGGSLSQNWFVKPGTYQEVSGS
jgi:hypothetical protein